MKTHGIDAVYEKVATPPEEFARFAATIGIGELRGANITVPLKQLAFAECQLRTSAAQTMGAVNTLWREGGLLWGDNTDAEGFLASLDEEAPGWRRYVRSALILGAGGASRAVTYALIAAGIERVTLINRTVERAEALSSAFGAKVVASNYTELSSQLAQADLLVNTTTLGMNGQGALDIDLSLLKLGAIVFDVVYAPLRTPLVVGAQSRGFHAIGGLGMLLHQAAPGFERWFGVRPRVTSELRSLVEADIVGSAGRNL